MHHDGHHRPVRPVPDVAAQGSAQCVLPSASVAAGPRRLADAGNCSSGCLLCFVSVSFVSVVLLTSLIVLGCSSAQFEGTEGWPKS